MIGLDIFLVVFSTSHSVINSLTFNLYTEQDSDPYPGLIRLIRIQANFVDMDPNSC